MNLDEIQAIVDHAERDDFNHHAEALLPLLLDVARAADSTFTHIVSAGHAGKPYCSALAKALAALESYQPEGAGK